MRWLEETHGTGFELTRHFFARMFDTELSSTPGQWQSVAAGAIGLLLPAGLLLLDPKYGGKYRELSMLPSPGPFRAAALADELSLLTLVFAITGLFAVLQWQSLFPSRRDYLALAALPVRSRQIFAARFTAFLLFAAAIVIAMNALPSLTAPIMLSGRWQKNPSFVANMMAHGVSAGLACFFIIFAAIALQGVLLNTLPARLFARISVYVQALLIAVLFIAAFFSRSISDWSEDTIARLPESGGWAPPVWFLGLHETMIGDHDPFFATMAHRALFASAAAAVLAILAYLACYARYRKLLLESSIETGVPRAREWSVLRLLGRLPRQEAILHFTAKTLARSRFHRVALLAYIGVAVAIVLNMLLAQAAATRSPGWRVALQLAALSSPLAMSVVVLAGLRHVFSMPSELRANWIFQITESQGRPEWMRAVERFSTVCAIVPIYLVTTPLLVAVLGWQMAVRALPLEILVSLSLFEVLFQNWQKLPFTCGYVPGKHPLMRVVIAYLAALGAAVPAVAFFIGLASLSTTGFLIFFGILGWAWVSARRLRRDGWGESKLIYDDIPQIVPDLGLRS